MMYSIKFYSGAAGRMAAICSLAGDQLKQWNGEVGTSQFWNFAASRPYALRSFSLPEFDDLLRNSTRQTAVMTSEQKAHASLINEIA